MEFKEFKQLQQRHIGRMFENASALFVAEVNRDELWELYLDSFPPGVNRVFRERRGYDCSCCRHFIKQFGNVIAIVDYKPVSIWGFQVNDNKFQPVLNALSDFINSANVSDVHVTKESAFGTDKSHEQLESGNVHTWEHFRVNLPSRFVLKSGKTVAGVAAGYRDTKNVFKRSLKEITKDAVMTVLDLIAEKTLYRGDEWRGSLEKFLALHDEYHSLSSDKQDAFCWLKSVEVGAVIGKIRNHSMGVLLVGISGGTDLNEAVRKYEAIVAPTNYKRPKAIFTKKMVERAEGTITKLGLVESLGRRHATLSDITVNNVLWVKRDAAPYMNGRGGVFELLKQEAIESPKTFDNVSGIGIEDFLRDIIPTATDIEVLLENRLEPNFATLIAPQVLGSPTMFKWDNAFSWAYNGNITDSMKERVKTMGGKVDGVLRASLQWENNNDFDLHCVEPSGGNHIYFNSKGRVHRSSGMLDVDIMEPDSDSRVVDGVAVENIIYSNEGRMPEGVYEIFIHNYSHRGGRSGFQAEIEYGGQIYSYEYPQELRGQENVPVAKFRFSKDGGIEFIESLPSTTASKNIWNCTTNQFYPVTAFMFSPNYWDEQTGIGNKHFFFIVNGCNTDDSPNGFFNEFLREDFMEHKRVFEALGSKMRVEATDNQLSGLGFSSTKRNSLICKVDGQKTIKVIF